MHTACVETRTTPLGATAFEHLVERHGREIRIHCYRMLGSIQDAEDAAQEALLRAWRGRGAFEGRASPRTWLTGSRRTSACARWSVARSPAAHARGTWDDVPFAPLGDADHDTPWLEPFPDAIVGDPPDPSPGPEARAEALDAVRLAFVIAI